MENTVLVQVLEAHDHARYKELGLFFSKLPVFANMVPQVPTLHQINHQVQIVPVFVRVLHIDQKSVTIISS